MPAMFVLVFSALVIVIAAPVALRYVSAPVVLAGCGVILAVALGLSALGARSRAKP